MTHAEKDSRRVIYSTDGSHTRSCPRCGADPCKCKTPTTAPAEHQSPRVRREVKGRGGKTVTVVLDLELPPAALNEVARQLKQWCATGGTVKDGRIEIQGDHRDKVIARLVTLGYRARAAGG